MTTSSNTGFKLGEESIFVFGEFFVGAIFNDSTFVDNDYSATFLNS